MSRQEVADACNVIIARVSGERGHRPRWAGLTAGTIGALERGEFRWPNEEYREALRILFSSSNTELGLYIDRPPRRSAGESATVTPPAPELTIPTCSAILAGIAAVAAASGFGVSRTTSTAGRVGASDVARLQAVTDLYRAFDYERGGNLLYRQVAELAEAATAFLDRPQSETVFRSLASAVAAARQLAGWTAFDAGLYADSQRHFLIADRVACGGEDMLMSARVRYCQARQFQHQNHNLDALHTLHHAHEQLGSAGTPAVEAMLYGAQAASLAALGDKDQALNRLGGARDAFERIDPDREPTWMRFYDRGELLAQYGRVYRDLARDDRRYGNAAVEHVTEAIAGFGPTNVRSAVLNQVGLCSSWFLADEPEQALRVGYQLVALGDKISSRRVLERMANIRRDIGDHRSRTDVADFDRVLADVVTAA